MKLYPIFCLLVLSLQAEVDCRNIDDVNVDVGSGIAHNLDTFSNSLVVVAVDSLVQVPDGGQEQRLQVEQQEELQYKVQQERLDENQQLKVHQLQGEEQRVQREEDKPQQQQLLTSPLCINKTRSSTSSAAPGCIMGSLIPRSKTYLVRTHESELLCFFLDGSLIKMTPQFVSFMIPRILDGAFKVRAFSYIKVLSYEPISLRKCNKDQK